MFIESENEEDEELSIGGDAHYLSMSENYVDLEGGRVPSHQILRDSYHTEKLDIKDKVKVRCTVVLVIFFILFIIFFFAPLLSSSS